MFERHLLEFETTAEFEAAESSLLLPNVSVIAEEDNAVVYKSAIKVNNVLLNKNTLTLTKGETETLVATVLPVDASNKSVTWSSSDSNIATVDDNGLVRGVGAGSATITVTTVDGGFTAQCVTEVSAQTVDGHEFVEIGGLKWATMNVGATAVTDNGLYFQWGDSSGYTAAQVGSEEGKKAFSWGDYKYAQTTTGSGSGSGSIQMLKYNETDGKTTLDAEDDGVVANWGNNWRMPTTDELQTLGDAVNTAWTSDYKSTGVAGLVCTAKDGSGAELFFPAAGICYDGSMHEVSSYGCCWSSSLDSSFVQQAYDLSFDNGYVYWQYGSYRNIGRSLRGIVNE